MHHASTCIVGPGNWAMGIKRGHEFLHREGGSSVVACGGGDRGHKG